MKDTDMIELCRETIIGSDKSWVLFENGTCVILCEPESDLVAEAATVLQEFGHVYAGSSFGDFGTVKLDNGHGWVVTSQHTDILTFIVSDELCLEAEDVLVGLLGRSKREQDAENLRIMHVEDKR